MGALTQVPVCSNLSADDFQRRFRLPNLPVVIRGEPEVTALETLRREFGDAPIPKAYEITRNERVEFDSVRHYLDALDAGGESQYYIQMRSGFPIDKKLSGALTGWWLSLKAPRYELGKLVAVSAWIGNAYFGFGLHRDECREQFLCQISGTKRIVLVEPSFAQTRTVYPYRSFQWGFRSQVFDSDEPDLARFPKFKDANIFAAALEPGDMLFLPKSWWHDVRPNGGLNASVGFRHLCDYSRREKTRLRLQILLGPRATGDTSYWFKSAEDPVEERFGHIKSHHFENAR